MVNRSKKNKIPPTKWQVELLRVTAFPIDNIAIDTTWWNDLSLGEKDSRIISKDGVCRDEGLFEENKLYLNVHANRIDWIYSTDLTKLQGPLPTFGEFSKVKQNFYNLIQKWLKIYSEISRLAFGTILLYSAGDKEENYKLISKYLPNIIIDPKDSSDFFYQINRPRDSSSGISDIKINRLMKWSVMNIYGLDINLLSNVTPVSRAKGIYACRLELDINTSADYNKQLAPKKLPNLFNELTFLGEEIISNGDIK